MRKDVNLRCLWPAGELLTVYVVCVCERECKLVCAAYLIPLTYFGIAVSLVVRIQKTDSNFFFNSFSSEINILSMWKIMENNVIAWLSQSV